MFFFSKKSKKIGIAFGGGGVRGIAHLGIIQVLLEEKVDVFCASGTSIGALAGAFFAAGRPVEEMLAIVNSLGMKDFMAIDLHFQGLSSSEKTVGKMIKKYIKHDSFSGLKMPFSVVTTDICAGKSVTIKKGSLSKSVSMSANFPTLFSPIEHEGSFYIDGGVFVNVPTKQVRELGAGVVIGIDLNPCENFSCVKKNALDIANRSVDLLIGAQEIRNADLIVRPIKQYHSLIDLRNKKALIEMGKKCAREEIIPFLRKKKLI